MQTFVASCWFRGRSFQHMVGQIHQATASFWQTMSICIHCSFFTNLSARISYIRKPQTLNPTCWSKAGAWYARCSWWRWDPAGTELPQSYFVFFAPHAHSPRWLPLEVPAPDFEVACALCCIYLRCSSSGWFSAWRLVTICHWQCQTSEQSVKPVFLEMICCNGIFFSGNPICAAPSFCFIKYYV